MQYCILGLFVLTVLLNGCDKTVAVAITDKALYSEFKIVYDKTTNTTTARAEFWEDGKNGVKKFFNPDAQLSFQDKLLEYRSEGAYYAKELTGYFISASFKIIDINKKQFVITSNVNTSEFYQNTSDSTIDLSVPYTLTWLGKALESGEYIIFRINENNFQQKTPNATNLSISVQDLAVLSIYKNQTKAARIERNKLAPLDKDLGAGGFMSVQYTGLQKNYFIK